MLAEEGFQLKPGHRAGARAAGHIRERSMRLQFFHEAAYISRAPTRSDQFGVRSQAPLPTKVECKVPIFVVASHVLPRQLCNITCVIPIESHWKGAATACPHSSPQSGIFDQVPCRFCSRRGLRSCATYGRVDHNLALVRPRCCGAWRPSSLPAKCARGTGRAK